MSCNCNKQSDFKSKIALAQKLTDLNKEQYVVYKLPVLGVLSVSTEYMAKISGACCYFLPNGNEVIVESEIIEGDLFDDIQEL